MPDKEWNDPQQDPLADIIAVKKRLEEAGKPFDPEAFVRDLLAAQGSYMQEKLMGVETEGKEIPGNVPTLTPDGWAPNPMDALNPYYELNRTRAILREVLDLHYAAEMELIGFFYLQGFGYDAWEATIGAMLFRVIVKGESAEIFREIRLGDQDPHLGEMFPRAVNLAVACETCNGTGVVRDDFHKRQLCKTCFGSGKDGMEPMFAPFDPTYGKEPEGNQQ